MSVTVRATLEENIMEEADAVLAAAGISVSDAFRMLLVRVAADGKLPFEPLVPNRETISAIEAARRGELVTLGTPEEAIAELNAPD